MNRIFATLMLGALAFSSCIKEDDSYKDLLPVQPGQYIYSYVTTQDRVAMQAANAGMRVAILAAEVAKQRPENENVTVATVKDDNGKEIYKELFSSETKIEEVADGYKLTFKKESQMPDGFYFEGSLLVKTNGASELADGAEWSVEMDSEFKLYSYSNYGGEAAQINMLGGTTLLKDNGDGSYTIHISRIAASVEGSNAGSSSWSTSLDGLIVRPKDEDVTLAYSSCKGKAFKVDGTASGPSLYGNIYDTGQIGMSYTVTDGLYIGTQIVSGTQECEFTSSSDYNTAAYPAPDVRYVFSFDESSRTYSYRIYYNGYTYPKG